MRSLPTPYEPTIVAPLHALATIVPDHNDRALSAEAVRALAPVAEAGGATAIIVTDLAGIERKLELPVSVLRMLSSLLAETACGNAVSLIPTHAELTTQEAADILNVSRPHLVGLLENGLIPFRKVGVQRRVRFRDVTDFKARFDAERHSALDALSRQAQELRLGYDE